VALEQKHQDQIQKLKEKIGGVSQSNSHASENMILQGEAEML
jgi:hypothetical protein